MGQARLHGPGSHCRVPPSPQALCTGYCISGQKVSCTFLATCSSLLRVGKRCQAHTCDMRACEHSIDTDTGHQNIRGMKAYLSAHRESRFSDPHGLRALDSRGSSMHPKPRDRKTFTHLDDELRAPSINEHLGVAASMLTQTARIFQ